MKIATYVNDQGSVVGFYDKGVVVLYELIAGFWTKLKEIPLEMSANMSIPEVRLIMKKVVNELGNCKVFLGAEVKGVPYAILEGIGFNIWKSEGSVEQQLDFVHAKELEALEESRKPVTQPQPYGDIRDGFFRINLSEVLNTNAKLSSQQILIPFMEKTNFQKLEILCDHPPRWLSKEFERLKLRAEVVALDSSGHELKITVFPK